MKYHYKSPGELQDQLSREREKNSKRNRTNWILFADLAVIVLIFTGVYYSGILTPKQFYSESGLRRGPFLFSATVQLRDGGEAAIYLNVKNDSAKDAAFPPADWSEARIEMRIPPNETMTAAIPTEAVPAIRPGETRIFRTVLPPLPGEFRREHGRVILEFSEENLILEL